ncbi:hypothetical protein LRS10_13535 [Phenylobacterium sp. J426]|uniref:hypothetical protein n=1 Tax=Phenylobacterium sp. J426 TaxID=2898439 RepID=UPI002151143B|nr:hypothetical protein [Phenylobacterium sp. J426]MCR5875115.1 hypothetical protein [Phenylobacterium sp. J426]
MKGEKKEPRRVIALDHVNPRSPASLAALLTVVLQREKDRQEAAALSTQDTDHG